jgi:hypothetical protein
MKNAILAKLAAQAADYYQEASTGLEAKSLKGVFPKVRLAHGTHNFGHFPAPGSVFFSGENCLTLFAATVLNP